MGTLAHKTNAKAIRQVMLQLVLLGSIKTVVPMTTNTDDGTQKEWIRLTHELLT